MAHAGGVTEVLFEWHGEMSLPSTGRSHTMRRINQVTGFEPLQRYKVSVMLLRKPSPVRRPYHYEWLMSHRVR